MVCVVEHPHVGADRHKDLLCTATHAAIPTLNMHVLLLL